MDAETRGLVEATLARVVDDVYQPPARLARLRAGPVDYRLHWPLLAELGVFDLAFSEGVGGMGAGALDLAQAIRVLARGLVLEPFSESAVVAAAVLGRGENAPAREQAAAAAMAGQRITVLVGLPRQHGELSLLPDGDTLRLSGVAQVVPYAAQADEWLVAAREPRAGERRILRIPRAQPGVTVTSFRLMDARPAGDIRFDASPLNPSYGWLRGAPADAALERASDLSLLVHGADALGVMEQLLAVTAEYLRTRVQFGVALGTFQALQHRFADMQIDMLEVRALVLAYARCLDGDAAITAKPSLQSALARLAARASRHIGHEAIQMHGGMGVTEELVVSHYNARLQVLGGALRAWCEPSEDPHAEAA